MEDGKKYVTFTELETKDLNSCKFRSFEDGINRPGYGNGFMLINKSNPTLLGHYNYYGGHGIMEVSMTIHEYNNLALRPIPVDHADNSQSMLRNLTLYSSEEIGSDTLTYQWKEIQVLRSQHNDHPKLKIISNEEKHVGGTLWDDAIEVITIPSTSAIYVFDGSKYVLQENK